MSLTSELTAIANNWKQLHQAKKATLCISVHIREDGSPWFTLHGFVDDVLCNSHMNFRNDGNIDAMLTDFMEEKFDHIKAGM